MPRRPSAKLVAKILGKLIEQPDGSYRRSKNFFGTFVHFIPGSHSPQSLETALSWMVNEGLVVLDHNQIKVTSNKLTITKAGRQFHDDPDTFLAKKKARDEKKARKAKEKEKEAMSKAAVLANKKRPETSAPGTKKSAETSPPQGSKRRRTVTTPVERHNLVLSEMRRLFDPEDNEARSFELKVARSLGLPASAVENISKNLARLGFYGVPGITPKLPGNGTVLYGRKRQAYQKPFVIATMDTTHYMGRVRKVTENDLEAIQGEDPFLKKFWGYGKLQINKAIFNDDAELVRHLYLFIRWYRSWGNTTICLTKLLDELFDEESEQADRLTHVLAQMERGGLIHFKSMPLDCYEVAAKHGDWKDSFFQEYQRAAKVASATTAAEEQTASSRPGVRSRGVFGRTGSKPAPEASAQPDQTEQTSPAAKKLKPTAPGNEDKRSTDVVMIDRNDFEQLRLRIEEFRAENAELKELNRTVATSNVKLSEQIEGLEQQVRSLEAQLRKATSEPPKTSTLDISDLLAD